MKAKFRDHLADEVDAEGTWAVSYGDMVTLLLCFFILFFTTDPKAEQQKKLEAALLDQLSQTAANPGQGSIVDPHKTFEINMGHKDEQGIDPALLRKWNGVAEKVGQQIIIVFPGTSFFKSGHIELSKEGQKALSDFGKVYGPYAGRYKLRVQASTDIKQVKNEPNRPFKNNLELSVLRSLSAMRQLISVGVPMNMIRLAGLGEMKMTIDQMDKIPKEKLGPHPELDLARKVILVIEPEEGVRL